jgi:hypothetical protein
MKSASKSQKLSLQLEHRKKNLAVVEETIRSDPAAQEILDPVKVFLYQRIESIELELRKS